jgi:hypothetical protein
VYYLDKIKRELFEIKKSLINCSLKDEDIDKFIEFLQVYSIPEPLLMVKHFKFIFKAMAVIFACMMVIVLVVYFSLPYLIEPVRAYSDDLAKKMEVTVAKIEELKDDTADKIDSHWYYRWPLGWVSGLLRKGDKKKKNDPNPSHDIKPARQVDPPQAEPQKQAKPAVSAQVPAAVRHIAEPVVQQSRWSKIVGWWNGVKVPDSQVPDSLP